MQIYGLSGTQGCGKTTLINNMQKTPGIMWESISTSTVLIDESITQLIARYGSDAQIIPHQPTILRTILKNHGIVFDRRYYSDPLSITKVQATALVSMVCSDLARLQKSVQPSTFSVSDRTYLDLEAYTRAYLHMYVDYDPFVRLYAEFCRLAALIVYDGILLLDFPNHPMADDGVRPTSASSQQVIHAVMHDISSNYQKPITVQQAYPHEMAQKAYLDMLRYDSQRHTQWTRTQRRLMLESLLSTITNNFSKFLIE